MFKCQKTMLSVTCVHAVSGFHPSVCFSDAACVNEFQDDCDDANDNMHHIVRRSVSNVSFFTDHMIFNPNLLFNFI